MNQSSLRRRQLSHDLARVVALTMSLFAAATARSILAAAQPPAVKITAPSPNVRLRQAQVSITGRTSNVGAGAAVYYALASTEDGPFTWFPATSENGFNDAPAAASGLVFSFKPDGLPAYSLILDDATFASSSSDTNILSGAANYTYTRTGVSTAVLSYQYFSPPITANSLGELLFLFNSTSGGVYFNTSGFEAGSFSVSRALNLAPATLAERTVVIAPGTRGAATLQFQADTLNWIVGGQTTVDGYQLLHPSPRTLLIAVASDHGPSDAWLQLTFSTATGGSLVYSSAQGILAKGSFSLR